MAEFIPESQIRAGATSLPVYFSRRIHDILSLDDLVDLFAACIAPFAASGHRCYRLGDEVEPVFGSGELPDAGQALRFEVSGWDGARYCVELRLGGIAPDDGERASLHAMAALYVQHGIALREAGDEDAGPCSLGAMERFCLEQSELGRCDLDIGEDTGRSVHAVRVLVERARTKLRPALLNG